MGYMRHHAIVVTSWSDKQIERAQREAFRIFRDSSAYVGDITPGETNGYRSFLIAPDGSKEGWEGSDNGDAARDLFTAWLDAERYDDGSTPLAWIEVQFGDDERETRIIRDSDMHARTVLDEAAAKLLAAYDQSGLTDLTWFAPYVEALRSALSPESNPEGQ